MAEERAQTKEKRMQTLGWVATVMSVTMYMSYIPQIIGNLHGNKGDFTQLSVAAVNCTLWVIYGLCKEKRDLPLAAVNFPGAIFGLTAASTALIQYFL